MKKLFILLSILLFGVVSIEAQGVGINKDNSAPDASAMLEVKNPNKGLLIPRIALTGTNDILTIPSPAISLLVYNTATTAVAGTVVTPGFYYWNGTVWTQFAMTGSVVNVPEVVNMRASYNAATTYSQNDLVSTGTNKDVFYYSLTSSNTGNTPGLAPGFWQAVEVEDLKQIHKTLSLANPGFTSLLSISISGTNTAGGRIQYTIRATDGGSQLATEHGIIQYVATSNSITCSVDATDKIHLGTVNSTSTPGFFNPASQPGVSVSDNVAFSSPASIVIHDVYFRIFPVGGYLSGSVYNKPRLRIEP